ncbi:XdhC family protein [Paenibacillus sp. CC-CFT747]|nr:XdhC family protein [Paenibacillus sp. CC-CFT747]
MEPVPTRLRECLRNLLAELEQGRRVAAIRRLDGEGAAAEYRFFPDSGSSRLLGKGGSARNKHIHGIRYFRKIWEPRPRLFVIGAGPDARPLAAMAAGVGFSVTVIDRRPAFCSKRYFPDAHLCLLGGPEDGLPERELAAQDYVVVMTHHFETDREWLRRLLETNIRYLGLLGPRKRASRLLAGGDIPPRLRTPVGLAIGAEGPEEIAVSVLADLIRVYRDKAVPGVEQQW